MANHLTLQERDRIAQLNSQGAQQAEIAQAIGRAPSTISRELQRNSTHGQYYAGQAQQRAERRRRERPLTRKADRPEIQEAVCNGLAQYWSPEEIAGRLAAADPQQPRPISARTIYAWIENSDDRDHWKSFLRRRGKRPQRPKKPAGMGAPIKDRPKVIEKRLRLGDFEGDTVLGPPGTGGLATLVDRKSRYTIVVKILRKEADHVQRKIRDRLKQLDAERRRSVTFDNGREFARCHRLETHLKIRLYFADPGRPHQRSTNENTNGLIRQFFPKGTEFRNVSHHDVRAVENLLNNRPRACLGFRTPDEVFFEKPPPKNCN